MLRHILFYTVWYSSILYGTVFCNRLPYPSKLPCLASVSPCFSYALASPFILLPTPFSCIYRHSRATVHNQVARSIPHTLQSLQLWPRIALSAEQSTELHHQIVLPHHFFHLVVSWASSNTKPIEHRTSNIARRTSNVEHRKSNIEPNGRSNIDRIEHQSHWTLVASNIDQTKPDRTNPTVRIRPPST